MGRKRDPGPGKYRGSHVDYVVEGVLPEGGQVSMAQPEATVEMTKAGERALTLEEAVARTPVRESRHWKGPLIEPTYKDAEYEGGGRRKILQYAVGLDVSELTPKRKAGVWRSRKLAEYETAEEYIAEIPEDIADVFGWYIRFLENGHFEHELPPGFSGMIYALRLEYPILTRVVDIARTRKNEFIRNRVLSKLVEYADDDRDFVRNAAVQAAKSALDVMETREAREEARGGGGQVNNGVVVNVNIAQMLGMEPKDQKGEILIDAQRS